VIGGPPGLDLDRLREYLDRVLPGAVHGSLAADLIGAGRSNLTYLVADGDGCRLVLRRPPLGHVLATAHDMGREFRVLGALRPTAVPVPDVLVLCAEPDVLGAPFYLMAYVAGTVYRSAGDASGLGPDRATAIAYELMDTLVALHSVAPDAAGLADFGRPDGYLERQLRRWATQLDASRSRPLPGIDELHAKLAERVPESGPATILHGDYRLDNVLVGAGDRIVAVLDWEMSTLGDPLSDAALMCVYRHPMFNLIHASSAWASPLIPEADDLANRYSLAAGQSLDNWDFYMALGYFKVAVIAAGIAFRGRMGGGVAADTDAVDRAVAPLIAEGLSVLSG